MHYTTSTFLTYLRAVACCMIELEANTCSTLIVIPVQE